MRIFYAAAFLTAFAIGQHQHHHGAQHRFVTQKDLTWTAMAIPNLEMAVVSGDPKAEGPFVIRIRANSEQWVPAHWHPLDENVTVISGKAGLGTGDKFDKAALRHLQAGDYVLMPKETRHFAWFAKGSVMQVHGHGPFVINWVNQEELKSVQQGQVDSMSDRTKLKQEQEKR